MDRGDPGIDAFGEANGQSTKYPEGPMNPICRVHIPKFHIDIGIASIVSIWTFATGLSWGLR